MLILTQYDEIINVDRYDGIRIEKDNKAEKWKLWAIKKDDAISFTGRAIGQYKTYDKAQDVIRDIIKKAEIGCNTYRIPDNSVTIM